MSHPNDPFRAPLPNPPFASTPNSNRMQRPRFAYSGPQNYPRPGSSASKPNPDFSVSDIMRSRYIPTGTMNDSMINNYGDSFMDTSMPSYSDSFESEYSSGSLPSQDSIYYSCNESFSTSPRKTFPASPRKSFPTSPRKSFPTSPQQRSQHPYKTNFIEPDISLLPPISNQPVRFKSVSSVVDPNRRKPFYKKKDVKPIGVVTKKHNDGISKHVWRCSLCDIVFTSSIPYNMHKRGSKHAKKLKLQEEIKTVQSQAEKTKEVEVVGTTFRCELCGIMANSPYQLKMHLEGIKHKTKVLQQKEEAEMSKAEKNEAKECKAEENEAKECKAEEKKAEPKAAEQKKAEPKVAEQKKAEPKTAEEKDTKVNGNEKRKDSPKKTDAPAAKRVACPTKTAFSCATCELFLNSEAQLQQHLLGKFHKAKVEGTTLPFHGKKKAAIRKAVDGIANKPNAEEEKKILDMMDVFESNLTKESSKTNKDEETDVVMLFIPETVKDGHPETSKDTKSEISKDTKSETLKDTKSETLKDTKSETSKKSEITKDTKSEVSIKPKSILKNPKK